MPLTAIQTSITPEAQYYHSTTPLGSSQTSGNTPAPFLLQYYVIERSMSHDLVTEYLGYLDDSGDYSDGEDDVSYESDESMGVHDPDSDDDPEAWDWKI